MQAQMNIRGWWDLCAWLELHVPKPVFCCCLWWVCTKPGSKGSSLFWFTNFPQPLRLTVTVGSQEKQGPHVGNNISLVVSWWKRQDWIHEQDSSLAMNTLNFNSVRIQIQIILQRYKMLYICLQIYLSFIVLDSWSAPLTLTKKTYSVSNCHVIIGISRELLENSSGLCLAVNIINWFCSWFILFAKDKSRKFWEVESNSGASKCQYKNSFYISIKKASCEIILLGQE